jgi:transcriptional regulator with XRE-family HTH domain
VEFKRLEQGSFYEEVGRRVRDARKRRKPTLTQDELGKLVGLTRTSITNLEHGRQKCLIHTLAEIASALHVEPSSLLPILDVQRLDLHDAVKDRPKSEKDWILSTVTAARKKREKS